MKREIDYRTEEKVLKLRHSQAKLAEVFFRVTAAGALVAGISGEPLIGQIMADLSNQGMQQSRTAQRITRLKS